MSEQLFIALVGFTGLMLSALIAGAVTLVVQLARWNLTNQQLWAWNRSLVDHIYRGSPPPPPEPPEGLFK